MPDVDSRAALLRYLAPGLLLAGVLTAGGFFYWWRFYAFTDQFYEPRQPIPFSHQLHAGTYQIPCQYCHFNAQRGKHAGAPTLSVCLGCHDSGKGAVAGHKPSIQRLLEFADTQRGAYDDDRDWDLQSDGVRKEGAVVHWNRVHLLPDHVYFSHEWHVKAGVSCQTCHGPVETMAEVAQFADLSMGWCIRCHRQENYTTLATERDGLHERYDGDAEDFRVGTANYEVLRARIRPDDVVSFNERETHANLGDGAAHADDHGHADEHPAIANALRGAYEAEQDQVLGENVGFWTEAQAEELATLRKKYPDLPRWRVADLPESHRAFYGEELLQNSPTQCSTCHQ